MGKFWLSLIELFSMDIKINEGKGYYFGYTDPHPQPQQEWLSRITKAIKFLLWLISFKPLCLNSFKVLFTPSGNGEYSYHSATIILSFSLPPHMEKLSRPHLFHHYHVIVCRCLKLEFIGKLVTSKLMNYIAITKTL